LLSQLPLIIPIDSRVDEIENISAAAAAVQNLLLAATAVGLATKWRTGQPSTDPLVKEALGLSTDQHLIAFIYLGYPEAIPPEKSKALLRRPHCLDREIDPMPELPELEVICEVLQRRVVNQTIEGVEIIPPCGPIVVRDLTHAGFERALTGKTIRSVARRGKFLLFSFEPDDPPLFLAINPKLTGRFRLSAPDDKRHKKTAVLLNLENGQQLRYIDQKQMGQVYLVNKLAIVPDYADLGPEPLEISLEEFRERLRPFRGEIKGVLTRGTLCCGNRKCLCRRNPMGGTPASLSQAHPAYTR
jgi:hypothetical protein